MSSSQIPTISKSIFANPEHSELVNLNDFSIDTSLPAVQRLESYFEQIVNPYCFLCGDTVVRIEYTDGAESLEEKILNYFIEQKNR